jgi:hypothetical protein
MTVHPSPAVPWREELVFSRRGGLAGFDDRLSIRPDGTATLVSERKPAITFHVEPAALAKLGAEVAALSRAKPTRAQTGPMADRLVYQLVLDGAGVEFAAGDMPPAFARAISQLEELVWRQTL